MTENYHAYGTRLSMAAICGICASFLILLIMKTLIANDQVGHLEQVRRIPLPEFVRVPSKDEPPPIREVKKPEKMTEPPPVPELPESDLLSPEIIATSGPGPGLKPTGQPEFATPLMNSEMISIVDAQPVYPQRAVSRNIEGYVIVEFTVTPTGSTTDVQVLEAQPEKIFNRSALRAASKSRFKPKFVDGKEVAVSGVRKKYTFKLED